MKKNNKQWNTTPTPTQTHIKKQQQKTNQNKQTTWIVTYSITNKLNINEQTNEVILPEG